MPDQKSKTTVSCTRCGDQATFVGATSLMQALGWDKQHDVVCTVPRTASSGVGSSNGSASDPDAEGCEKAGSLGGDQS